MICQPHFERVRETRPAIRMEMCADCLNGLPIKKSEEYGATNYEACAMCDGPNKDARYLCCVSCRQKAREYKVIRERRKACQM